MHLQDVLTMFMYSAHLKELVFDVLQWQVNVHPVMLGTKDVALTC
jgi:hypothetical protein